MPTFLMTSSRKKGGSWKRFPLDMSAVFQMKKKFQALTERMHLQLIIKSVSFEHSWS